MIRLSLVALVFPPLSFWLSHYLHKRKALLFESYITSGTHFFLRGPRAQALLESVKCGYDDKYSIAYIDLLYLENTPIPEGITVGSPVLPVMLAISGEGTLLNPYTLGGLWSVA